jgi:hypothetical protein
MCGTSNHVGGLDPGHDLGREPGREVVRELLHGLDLELTFWWKDAFENMTMQLRRLWRMILSRYAVVTR